MRSATLLLCSTVLLLAPADPWAAAAPTNGLGAPPAPAIGPRGGPPAPAVPSADGPAPQPAATLTSGLGAPAPAAAAGSGLRVLGGLGVT